MNSRAGVFPSSPPQKRARPCVWSGRFVHNGVDSAERHLNFIHPQTTGVYGYHHLIITLTDARSLKPKYGLFAKHFAVRLWFAYLHNQDHYGSMFDPISFENKGRRQHGRLEPRGNGYAMVPIQLDWRKTGFDSKNRPNNDNIAY